MSCAVYVFVLNKRYFKINNNGLYPVLKSQNTFVTMDLMTT